MRLTILLFDGFAALDVVGGYELLANLPALEVEFAAAAEGVVATGTGRLGMLAYRRFDQPESTAIRHVPRGPGVVTRAPDTPF
jgi:putative intracellular protease/amidase